MRRVLLLLLVVTDTLLRSLEPQAPNKSHKMQVRFLAKAASIRSSWSGNDDFYLVEVYEAKGSPVFAKLSRHFSSFDDELPIAMLERQATHRLSLRRDQSCDVMFGTFSHSWILGSDGKIEWQSSLKIIGTHPVPEIADDYTLPCYRLLNR